MNGAPLYLKPLEDHEPGVRDRIHRLYRTLSGRWMATDSATNITRNRGHIESALPSDLPGGGEWKVSTEGGWVDDALIQCTA